MITELRLKSQVTIPKAIVNKLHLSQGDQLEIKEVNGAIKITPVVVYPKRAIEKLQREAQDLKKDSRGEVAGYRSVDELFEALEK